MNSNKIQGNKKLVFIIIIIFIAVEIIDEVLDYILKTSLTHSIFQILLHLILFFIIYYIFNKDYSEKIKILLPTELIDILKTIKNAGEKNILLNQVKILSILKITKPTMKKRIIALLKLDYICFEKKGNHKYFKLTKKGEKIIN